MACMYSDKGETLSTLFARAKRFGITTSMDTSFPGVDTPSAMADWRKILSKTLPYVDVFIPSYEEILMLLDRQRYLSFRETYPDMGIRDILDVERIARMADELLDMGAGMVVVKCGIAGAYFKSASSTRIEKMGRLTPPDLSGWSNREGWIPSLYVEHICSTNGAGDTFVAGFLQGLLLGRSLGQTADLAAGSAASRLESESGSSGIPHYSEIERRIRSGWETEPFPLPGWEKPESGIFRQRERE
jgi:sugar/nucleoside kinase (ribokinase family)